MAAYEYWRVEVQFTAGTWTDVTSDVDGPVRSTNGATPETTGEPASLSLVLHNPGFKYTPGNTSSATALATGMPIRFFEVISDQYVYHFTGFVEFPEIASANLSMTQSQTIAVSAVDQLSSWERSATFVSTLGAHIQGSAPTGSLIAYYPLNDHGQFGDVIGRQNMAAPSNYPSSSPLNTLGESDSGPPGDDTHGEAFSRQAQASSYPSIGLSTLAIPSSAGGKVAVAVWYKCSAGDQPGISFFTAGANGVNISMGFTAGQISASTSSGTYTATLTSSPIDVWRLLTATWDTVVGTLTVWLGSDQVVTAVGVPGGAGDSPGNVSVTVGTGIAGFADYDVAHLQIYIGTTTLSYADHLAQFAVGLTGLERQATGERIKTLGRYAGLTDGQLVNVDTGCSIMQAARLAGQTVAQAMYEARDTEQGDLFVDGAGNLTFHDRRTILNI